MPNAEDFKTFMEDYEKRSSALDFDYAELRDQFREVEDEYFRITGMEDTILRAGTLEKVKSLITNNKGALVAVATAVGIPVGLADSGAFGGVINLLKGVIGL